MWRGSIGDYGSHYPVLAAAVAKTFGPVLELGMGDWSTPMLHYLCRALKRQLISIDADEKWMGRFHEYSSPGHHVCYTEPDRWLEETKHLSEGGMGTVFIDCAPGEIRHKLVAMFKDAQLVVAHDSERDHGAGANYKYEEVRPLFKYVTEFRRFRPYTLLLSNYEPFEIDETDRVWYPPDEVKP